MLAARLIADNTGETHGRFSDGVSATRNTYTVRSVFSLRG